MGIVKGNFRGGLKVIEVRPHTAADMDIPPTLMMNSQRIQAHFDVRLANRGCGPSIRLSDCGQITGYAEVIPVNPNAPLLPACRPPTRNLVCQSQVVFGDPNPLVW
jgi:hypothetical protein